MFHDWTDDIEHDVVGAAIQWYEATKDLVPCEHVFSLPEEDLLRDIITKLLQARKDQKIAAGQRVAAGLTQKY